MSDHICPWWLAYTFDNPFRQLFHNPEKVCGSYVARGMTVLDVGCGMGFFSIGLAKLVGDNGSVISADIQSKMLNALERRAEKAKCSDRIRIHLSQPNKLGVETAVDFILAFWMVHEVPDIKIFFSQIRSCLKSSGRILIVEPKFHVSLTHFQEILISAQESGLNLWESPRLRFSRAAVLKNDSL